MDGEASIGDAITEIDPGAVSAPTPAGQGEERILIGRYSVPLGWALSWSRGDCRDCSGKGWIERVDQRGVRVLCHRCVLPRATRRLNEQLRAAAPEMVPLAPPAPDPAEEEHHQRKVAALRRQLGELEDELTSRGVRHARSVQADRDSCGALVARDQELSTRVLAQTVRQENLREEVGAIEALLASRQESLRGAEAALVDLRSEQQSIATSRAAIEGPLARADERFGRLTAGLRKEIAKARRRYNQALARYAPGGGEGDLAAGAGPAVETTSQGDPGLRPDPAGAPAEASP